MKRAIIIAALALCGAAAQVQAAEAPSPAWQGVWKGTVGTLPVQACFNRIGDSFSRGAYYYLSSKRLIGLEEERGGWVEKAGKGGAESGFWTMAIGADGALRGEWQGGGKVLPVTLKRTGSAEDQEEACGAREFIAPRLLPVKVKASPGNVLGLSFTMLKYQAPASFADVSLQGFSFTPVQPGDKAILAALKLDPDSQTGRGSYADCMQGAIRMLGNDGEYSREVSPEWASSAFLAVLDNESGFCGGAHPYYGYSRELWDRQSGKRVDMARWFTPAGVVPSDYKEISATHQITTAMRAVVLRYVKTDDVDCRGVAEDQEWWGIGVDATGMVFTPSLPHVVAACTDDAFVPFAALAKFLSPEGKAQVARVKATRKPPPVTRPVAAPAPRGAL